VTFLLLTSLLIGCPNPRMVNMTNKWTVWDEATYQYARSNGVKNTIEMLFVLSYLLREQKKLTVLYADYL
jgi:hypothetical protein